MYTITINVQYACYSTGLKIKYYYYIIIACFPQREKPPWGADSGFELGPAMSRPAHYQLSHAAPYLSYAAPYLSHAAPY
jgi:hypothetical protein